LGTPGAPLHNATLAGTVLRCARHRVGQPLNAICAGLSGLKRVYDYDRSGIDP